MGQRFWNLDVHADHQSACQTADPGLEGGVASEMLISSSQVMRVLLADIKAAD